DPFPAAPWPGEVPNGSNSLKNCTEADIGVSDCVTGATFQINRNVGKQRSRGNCGDDGYCHYRLPVASFEDDHPGGTRKDCDKQCTLVEGLNAQHCAEKRDAEPECFLIRRCVVFDCDQFPRRCQCQ